MLRATALRGRAPSLGPRGLPPETHGAGAASAAWPEERDVVRIRLFAAVSISVALVVATTDIASAEDPPPPLDAAAARLPDSDVLREPVIADGSLDPTSASTTADVAVVAYAWPSVDVQEAMEVGTTFHLLPVARTVTDPDGAYELKVDPDDIPAPYVSSDGLVDLTISAASVDSVGQASASVAVTDSGFADPLTLTRGDTPEPPADQVVDLAERETPLSPAEDGTAKPWTECGMTLLERGVYRNARVADGLAAGSQKSQFVFRNTQTVTMGVALDISTDTVGWKASGEVSRSNSFEWTSLENDGRTFYSLQTEMGKYKEVCYQNNGGALSYMYTVYYWRPIRLTGGTSASPSWYSPTWTHCYDVGGGWWSRASSSYSQYFNSVGLSISDLVGFSVHSRQQWDTYGQLRYYTPTNSGYQLCGNNDVPSQASRIKGKVA